jgi:segregation and condensation protein A
VAYEVRLDNFEGPLDLLIHLIRKNEMDIYDIPIADIAAQYLTIIEDMQNLNLDIAGEFLLMAATLLHIKSRMLLPQQEEEAAEEEELDPRAELVRRLLEYQRYKAAAAEVNTFPLLDRDVFARRFFPPELAAPEAEPFEAVGLYDLVEAFRLLLRQTGEGIAHEVMAERLSVVDRINRILFLLTGREAIGFRELFSERPDRHEVVVTFLAMLELIKMRTIRCLQTTHHGAIWLYPAVAGETDSAAWADEDSLGYG